MRKGLKEPTQGLVATPEHRSGAPWQWHDWLSFARAGGRRPPAAEEPCLPGASRLRLRPRLSFP